MSRLFKNKEGTLLMLALSLSVLGILLALSMVVVIQNPSIFEKGGMDKQHEKEVLVQASTVENGIDLETGFIASENYQLVKANCTGCHSSKLVLQNRATREGWLEMIRWMQATQKLWDLGENEEPILDYLSTHYGPVDKGRRANLAVDEWYELD